MYERFIQHQIWMKYELQSISHPVGSGIRRVLLAVDYGKQDGGRLSEFTTSLYKFTPYRV